MSGFTLLSIRNYLCFLSNNETNWLWLKFQGFYCALVGWIARCGWFKPLALIVAIEEKIPLEVRSQVLTLTAGLVVLTSLINATTVKWLIDKLGLSKVGEIKG